ncbi:hypothetical protein GE21DRAFT_1079713 [Neurospora crassa]|nr:hypothetical protein GE21DRAFT_1079713 [Neurospora crassa]
MDTEIGIAAVRGRRRWCFAGRCRGRGHGGRFSGGMITPSSGGPHQTPLAARDVMSGQVEAVLAMKLTAEEKAVDGKRKVGRLTHQPTSAYRLQWAQWSQASHKIGHLHRAVQAVGNDQTDGIARSAG